MGFIDWVKKRGKDSAEMPKPDLASREAGKNLFAEWKQDYRLARQRDETGKEPESVAPEAAQDSKPEKQKAPARRERLKGHDITF
jgi:hypothetical protein